MKEQGMSRPVDPERVKTLSEWVSRWPKVTNLGFDSETREPTIYSRDAPYTSVVGTIPWKREGDTMTILSQSDRFSEQAVTAARKRYDEFHEAEAATRTGADGDLRAAEADLLAAWREFHAAAPADRPSLRRPILTAERNLREKEAQTAPAREVREFSIGVAVYVEPLPLDRRALAIAEVAS